MILDSSWFLVLEIGVWVLAGLCVGALGIAIAKPFGDGFKNYHRQIWAAVACLSLVVLVCAEVVFEGLKEQRTNSEDAFDAIKIVEPQLTPNQVRRSSFHPDIFEVFNNGQIRYVIGDEYVIKGEVLALANGENLTQKQLSAYRTLTNASTIERVKQQRLEGEHQSELPDAERQSSQMPGTLSSSQPEAAPVPKENGQKAPANIDAALAILANDIIPDEMTVVYPADGEEKYQLTIFSDVTCPVCRRNHQDYEAFQEQGVTVRAALFPRAGMEAPEAQVMSKILCADTMEQRRSLLDRAYEGDQLQDAAMCENGYLENIRNIAIARDAGLAVERTPTMMSNNGVRIDGYPRDNPIATVMGLIQGR